MEVRLFKKKEDYPILLEWWKARGQNPGSIDFLSDWGVIVSDGQKPVAALWLYPMVSTKLGMIMSPISNPDTTKEQRDIALNICLNTIHEIAKDLGHTTIMGWTNVPPFEKRLESHGYTPGDKNCTHYWGGL